MSGYFDPLRGSQTVHFDDHYYAVLRHITVQESMDVSEQEKDTSNAGLAGMALAIVEWNLDDAEGNIIPTTAEVLRRMPQKDFVKMSNLFNEMEGNDNKATFPESTGNSNPDEGAGTSNPAAVPVGAVLVGAAGSPLAGGLSGPTEQ